MIDVKETFKNICTVMNNEVKYMKQCLSSEEASNESLLFDNVVILDSCPASLLGREYNLQGKKGIYFFVYNDDFTWSSEQIGKFNSLGGAPFNFSHSKKCKKGEVCYLGSTADSLYKRIRNHYYDNGLHLYTDNRKFLLPYLKIYAFPLKREYETYQKLILQFIEKKLHNTFKPTNGSNRT